MRADHAAAESDELVQKIDAAGAISFGATATPEFGFAAYTESVVAPPARTPYDLACGALDSLARSAGTTR